MKRQKLKRIACVSYFTRNSHHLDLREMWIKDKVADDTCVIVKVTSVDSNSDTGNKRVPILIFTKLTLQIVDRSGRANLQLSFIFTGQLNTLLIRRIFDHALSMLYLAISHTSIIQVNQLFRTTSSLQGVSEESQCLGLYSCICSRHNINKLIHHTYGDRSVNCSKTAFTHTRVFNCNSPPKILFTAMLNLSQHILSRHNVLPDCFCFAIHVY